MSKKMFRPLGPQFGLKIRGGGRVAGLPGPSPGSATVDKGGLEFSTITDLFGKSHISPFSVAFYQRKTNQSIPLMKGRENPHFSRRRVTYTAHVQYFENCSARLPILSHADVVRSSLRARSYSRFSVPWALRCTQTCINLTH